MSQIPARRVLVIDDQAAIHEDYRKILGDHSAASTAALDKAAAQLFGETPLPLADWEGFDIDSAFQGQEGLDLVVRAVSQRRPYAMAFVDIRMPPGWDGVETVRRIWEVDPEILVVLCSAYSDYSWQEMVRELGRNDRYLILRKPFDNIEVRQCAMALTERWNQTRTDLLTGLLNRRAFRSYLDLEWRQWHRHNRPLSCAMFDLDYFKRVNDSLGHQAGDLVVKQLAQVLLAKCRPSDSICRYGGDEICVMLPCTSKGEAAAWAESVRLEVERMPILLEKHRINVTTSIGIAERIEDDQCPEQLIDRADQMLIRAKSAGRNIVLADSGSCHTSSMVADRWDGACLRDVMSPAAISFRVTSMAGDVARFLVRCPVESAPVVDADGKLVGVVSAQELIAAAGNQSWWQLPIERIMCRGIPFYTEDTPLRSVVAFLECSTTHRLFVVRHERPVGVVGRRELVRYCLRGTGALGEGGPAANLQLIGAVDRERLEIQASRLAELAATLPPSADLPASDPEQAILMEMLNLLTHRDDPRPRQSSGSPLPILAERTEISGFPAPNAPTPPLG